MTTGLEISMEALYLLKLKKILNNLVCFLKPTLIIRNTQNEKNQT